MANKREIVRQCRQIRELVEENKYTKALELIQELPLEEVESLDDLFLYAELYEKAEHMDKKKAIYYLIYDRTKSRQVLNKLVRLAIRLGDMQEARDLYVTYEMTEDITLDTYELRYLLTKAEGESRSHLIDILEDLKKEEYTEEWGFQLARLYEMEGMRDKCIQECKDLKLWFGEGRIVDKAVELQKKVESPDWEPPLDEEIPEVEERESEAPAYAAPAVQVQEMEPVEKMKQVEPVESEEIPPQEEREEPERTASQEGEEELEGSVEVKESVSEPVVGEKKQVERPKLAMEQEEELPAEDEENVSERGISYRTLKSTIYRVRHGKERPHFVFAGGEERMTLAVAKRITKELNYTGRVSTHNIGKISAEKLNEIDLSAQITRIQGGCMLVTNAPELSQESVKSLMDILDNEKGSVVVMLAGAFDEMDCFLAIYPNLAKHFTYKVKM